MHRNKILIGVSSCLLGNEVRHDGSHKRDRYITDTLSEYFDFHPYCPETAIGLGIPRPAIRLVSHDDGVRLVGSKDPSLDYTEPMNQRSAAMAAQLGDLSGYILKSKSPSCGMERVSLYQENGYAMKTGVGLFAAALMQAQPHLPVEEEGRLNDPGLRENFIERVFAFHRWQHMISTGLTVNSLMEFHRIHKYTLLAHHEPTYRELGQLIAQTSRDNLDEQADLYLAGFTRAMRHQATRKQHVNVLQHCMGYLKKAIDTDDKQELLEVFEKYAAGELPLVVPITLLRHHFRRHPQEYINEQVYMNPYPEELMLRNHV